MKLTRTLNNIVREIAVELGIPDKQVLRILDAHFQHIRLALSEEKPVEVKLDYFGKIVPIENNWKYSKKDDIISNN